jgi:hypothetical protein
LGVIQTKRKIILMILPVLIGLTIAEPLMAADILHRLTHNDQYALVLGHVRKVSQSSFEFSVARIISGHRLPSPIVIIKPDGTDQPQAGEKLLVSLERTSPSYKIRWGLFRVSNLDPKRLKIIKSSWSQGDLAALEHYIHTNGTEHDFFFVFSSAFLQYKDGTFTRIYPGLAAGQRTKHFKLMICPERQDYHPTDSATPGIGLDAIYYRSSENVRFCWETNYGEFVSWEFPDYKVVSLGKKATVQERKRIYWSPPLTQEAIPEKGIKVSLTVKSLKSEAIYERAYIEIKPKEGGYTVK